MPERRPPPAPASKLNDLAAAIAWRERGARQVAARLGDAVAALGLVAAVPAWLLPGTDTPAGAALGLTAVGLGLGISNRRDGHSARLLAKGCGAGVALYGAAVLLGYATGQPEPAGGGPLVALALAALGLSLLMLEGRPAMAQATALAALALGTFGLIDLFLDGGGARAGHDRRMSIPAAVLSCAAAAGVLISMPASGVVRVFTLPGPAGFYARRVLPVTLLVPVVLAYLRALSHRTGVDFSLGLAVMTMMSIALALFVGVWGAQLIHRSEAQERKAAVARDRARRELELANRELESFSYSISHDLRAPLRAIAGYAEILEEDEAPRLSEQGRHYLHRVRDSATRMSALIDGLLELTRLSREPLRLERVDLSALAAEVAAELRSDDVPTELMIAPGLIAHADPRLVQTVLQNLLANAFKFTRNKPRRTVEVGRSAQEGAFFVRDNGAGFDPAYAQKLFGAFQRLHAHDEFEGSGIGLATCQRVIARHGGRIWATAVPGEGATFSFTLPAPQSPDARPPEERPGGNQQAGESV